MGFLALFSVSISALSLLLLPSLALLLSSFPPAFASTSASASSSVPPRSTACSLQGTWEFQGGPDTIEITQTGTSPDRYKGTCVPSCGWDSVEISPVALPAAGSQRQPHDSDKKRRSSPSSPSSSLPSPSSPSATVFSSDSFEMAFLSADGVETDRALAAVGGDCRVLNIRGSLPWCRDRNNCNSTLSAFWQNGKVVVLEVAHSDILWLGRTNDMKLDASQIAMALDMMKVDPSFAWQHEDMIIFRAFLAFYPEREAELVQRMQEGRFDIGATFTEPFEETLYNELLLRQVRRTGKRGEESEKRAMTRAGHEESLESDTRVVPTKEGVFMCAGGACDLQSPGFIPSPPLFPARPDARCTLAAAGS